MDLANPPSLRKSSRTPRVYIVGLNDPESSDPAHALSPRIVGSSGNRLWKMANRISGVSAENWEEWTQRINLLHCKELPRDYQQIAQHKGRRLGGLIYGRTTILLGREVARYVQHYEDMFKWSQTRDWICIPHPNNKAKEYTFEGCQLATGILLSELVGLWLAENSVSADDIPS